MVRHESNARLSCARGLCRSPPRKQKMSLFAWRRTYIDIDLSRFSCGFAKKHHAWDWCIAFPGGGRRHQWARSTIGHDVRRSGRGNGIAGKGSRLWKWVFEGIVVNVIVAASPRHLFDFSDCECFHYFSPRHIVKATVWPPDSHPSYGATVIGKYYWPNSLKRAGKSLPHRAEPVPAATRRRWR